MFADCGKNAKIRIRKNLVPHGSDGIGVGVGVGAPNRSRKRSYDPVKIENRSRKRSHKIDGIGVGRIRTFPFLPISFTTALHHDLVKTGLSESEAEADETTNREARKRAL